MARTLTLVYLGPTLAAAEASALLPAAQLRPPVAVGDVLRVVKREKRVKRIAIVDGYFERMAAVWHKELLLALEAGIEVWGAASMGALRAAELAPWGMRGVGRIYERFASGELSADDEVAVAHLPAEYGYRTTSTALVDLRAGIERAELSDAQRAELVAIAARPFYRERSWDRLLADAPAALRPAITAVRETPSQKAADARALLAALAAPGRKLAAPRLRVPRTWALRQLRVQLL